MASCRLIAPGEIADFPQIFGRQRRSRYGIMRPFPDSTHLPTSPAGSRGNAMEDNRKKALVAALSQIEKQFGKGR